MTVPEALPQANITVATASSRERPRPGGRGYRHWGRLHLTPCPLSVDGEGAGGEVKASPPLTRLLLLRHGETTWNVTGHYQGRMDTDLSERGRRQAALVAQHLRGTHLDAIYSSPLKRALETVEPVARDAGLVVRVESGFTEIEHGLWEGLHKSEVEERYGDSRRLWLEHPTRAEIPGGETLEEVRSRVQEALSRIVAQHPEQTVLLCTHDAVLKVLITSALGLGLDSFWSIQVDNASLSILEHDGRRGRLLLLNDTCYLGEERSDSREQAL